jgi:ABC-type transport system involved in multi-copper enzyme maturation permease subunit
MTAAAGHASPDRRLRAAHRPAAGATLPRVARSEWTKLRTLPSACWLLLSAAVLTVGFGILYAELTAARPPHGRAAAARFDPVSVSLSGVQLAVLAAGVLGVLAITGEFGTGQIRSTLTAVPRRLPVLWGKAAALAAACLAVCLPATLVAFLAGQAILTPHRLGVTLSHPGAARAVLGSALFLTAAALFGLGLGGLIRSTAGAVAVLAGTLFGLQILVGLLPGSWPEEIGRYLPAAAATAVTEGSVRATGSLGPWAALGLFCGYAAAAVALAAWQMRRRDT